MSIIQHRFLPRSMFDMDLWMRPSHLRHFEPSTLDIFDPFDDLDRLMGRNYYWLNKPDFLTGLLGMPLQPRVSNKYRISVDCAGYSADSIKIDVSKDKTKLVVSGSEGEPNSANPNDDYSHRKFKRTYKLPENAEVDKMASFMTSNGQLVIEVPLKEEQTRVNADGDPFPRIVDGENGAKLVTMSLPIPDGLDPAKIKVTCKDRDVIVQAEEKQENSDHVSQTYFYRRCTLPENTDFGALKCVYDNQNRLSIKAPLNLNYQSQARSIPIEMDHHKRGEDKSIKN